MRIIKNITNNFKTTKRAAMYYKTEPFFVNVSDYTHTNNWEILQAIKILNQRGYSVDLIDRGHTNWSPTEKYDIFLGLGVGNTGRNFARFAQLSGANLRILLAMGPQPDISNERVLRRYEKFHERTGHYAPPMRTVLEVTGKNFEKIIENTDVIFNIGEKDTPSYNSFLGYGKPVLNFYPSTSPAVKFNSSWIGQRDPNSFLCFAGNGFICKGVDLVVESFLRDSSKQLHICGPRTEGSFFSYYGDKITNAPNIHYHGFIKPGGALFNQLAAKCSFVVFHSSSEGCCTSVATAIKAGLVPIINPWTGILVDDCGIILPDDHDDLIGVITSEVQAASSLSADEYKQKVELTLQKSSLFSQDSFTQSYSAAIDQAIGNFCQ